MEIALNALPHAHGLRRTTLDQNGVQILRPDGQTHRAGVVEGEVGGVSVVDDLLLPSFLPASSGNGR